MKDFKKYFTIQTTPAQVYEALTNPNIIEIWSGYGAMMSTEANSEFSLWEGDIEGKNIEFEKDRKIVQHWYFGEQKEDSVVTIILHPHKSGTSVELKHTNIPDEVYDEIVEGWTESYFGSVAALYEQ